jgi:YggT family protein
MQSLVALINEILGIYTWVVVAAVVLSLLISFNVVNTRNQFVYTLGNIVNQLTEPVLRPIRRILPPMGGLDFSPLVLLLLISFGRSLLCETLGPCGFRY